MFLEIRFGQTPQSISIFIVAAFIILISIIINIKVRKADPLAKPKGLLLVTEIFVKTINDFVIDVMGERHRSFAPYAGFLAIYLFLCNTIGLLGFTPPTTSISVTGTLGIISFLMIHISGTKAKGSGHIKSLFEPSPVLFPLNLIGEIAVPVSLSFRLFGNILSGSIIMLLIYTGFSGLNGLITEQIPIFSILGTLVTPVFHAYFDLFAGLIQTFVFMLLTMVFISSATE